MMDDLIDECTFDYSTDNKQKTHILVVEFPVACDELTFLLVLKNYLKAQNENLRRMYDDKVNH